MVVLDTSVIVAYTLAPHPRHGDVRVRILYYLEHNIQPAVPDQVLYEYYVVLTRPQAVNGFGFLPKEALNQLERLHNSLVILPHTTRLYNTWYNLLAQYQVRGKPAHDARIVAAMQTHGLRRLYTLNPRDFQRYGDLLELV